MTCTGPLVAAMGQNWQPRHIKQQSRVIGHTQAVWQGWLASGARGTHSTPIATQSCTDDQKNVKASTCPGVKAWFRLKPGAGGMGCAQHNLYTTLVLTSPAAATTRMTCADHSMPHYTCCCYRLLGDWSGPPTAQAQSTEVKTQGFTHSSHPCPPPPLPTGTMLG